MTHKGSSVVHPEASQPPFRLDGWTWCDPFRGEHFRRCSFCGSIHPDDLAAEPAWRAHWADRKYGWPHKFYVDVPNRAPEAEFVLGASHTPGPGYVARDDLTDDQLAVVRRDGFDRGDGWLYVHFGTRAAHHAKFYTVHLADPDLSADSKKAIERVAGLAFEFTGSQVRWSPV